MNVIVVLTACVVPNSNDVLVVSDILERKQQYIYALNWYLKHTKYRYVFCENSGTDISSEISRQYIDRVEFLTYSSSYSGSDRSKGYKEMEILEFVTQNSQYVKDADIIIKATGRLILKNITRHVGVVKILKTQDWIYTTWNGRNQWSDSRFMFFSLSYFRQLVKYKDSITSEYFFENVVVDSIRNSNIKFIHPLFAYRIEGIGGGFGNNYSTSLLTHLLQSLQCVKRFVMFLFGLLPR